MDNVFLDEYKSLVFRREHLRKEAQSAWINYIKEFGELIEKECSLKIECIKLKKTIAYCQARQNRGEIIFGPELRSFIESAMSDYYDELQTIITVRDSSSEKITEIDYFKLKRLYRRLALMLHPDLHPNLFEHEEVSALWERITDAYRNNDYDELQALEVLAVDMVKRYEHEEPDISPENIREKIFSLRMEINEIIHTDPYCYRALLRDDEAITEKKRELQSTIDEYEKYLSDLKKEAEKYTIEDGTAWEIS